MTRGRVEELKENVSEVVETAKTKGRRKALVEMGVLLSKRSLAQWLSPLEDMIEEDGLVMEDLY